MDRRDFLKGLTLVSAAAGTATASIVKEKYASQPAEVFANPKGPVTVSSVSSASYTAMTSSTPPIKLHYVQRFTEEL